MTLNIDRPPDCGSGPILRSNAGASTSGRSTQRSARRFAATGAGIEQLDAGIRTILRMAPVDLVL
jgi:hypothetical protein